MPPKRKQKSAEQKKEDAERQKKILSTKEKMLSTKRMVFSLVEVMIEKEVSKEWFLTNCTKLCNADYNDVIHERSIGRLCGYPLCRNIIKETLKQRYHISRVTNKVYDLTERKCFCSNECYKASNYLRAQLSPIPLYMRKEETIKVHLLSDCDNRGSRGEEVLFHVKIPQNEINEVYNMKEVSNNPRNMLDEEVKKCADSLVDLKLKEHIFEKEFVFCDETPKKSGNSSFEAKDDFDSDAEHDDNDDSDDSLDEKLFPTCENVSVLDQKLMPIPEKIKKTVLINDPATPDTNSTRVQQLSLDFVIDIFKDWMTEDSYKYLLGEKYVYGVKAEHLFQRMTSAEPLPPEKLSSIKNEYIKLSLKIDSLPDDDSDVDDSLGFDIGIGMSSASSIAPKQAEVKNNTEKRVFKRRPKRNSADKGKHVTFSQDTKFSDALSNKKTEIITEEKVAEGNDKIIVGEDDKNVSKEPDKVIVNEKNTKAKESHEIITESTSHTVTKEQSVSQNKEPTEEIDKSTKSFVQDLEEETSTENPPPEPLFPLVDSVSQNTLRKKLFINNLKSVYNELLPVIGLHYIDVREAIRKFVDTLSLTPTNIIFKPKEWKLISVVLLRVLTRTVLQDIHDESQLLKLYGDPIVPIFIDVLEMEKVVSHIISVQNIIRNE